MYHISSNKSPVINFPLCIVNYWAFKQVLHCVPCIQIYQKSLFEGQIYCNSGTCALWTF